MRVLSPAKINLTLRVTGLRGDGFHEMESLVARLNWGDEATVAPRADERITLSCSAADGADVDVGDVPTDERNLAVRAALALRGAVDGLKAGAHIELKKRIPTGAGLGGGSSNAATVLAALNEKWGIGFSNERLIEIGATIGSDVPLFLCGSPCVLRGRGELVEEAGARLRGFVMLALPRIHCSTPAVYAAWDRMSDAMRGEERSRLEEVLIRGATMKGLMPALFNDLEAPAFAVSGELKRVFEALTKVAGGVIRMTGSGAGMFRLFDEEREAREIASEAVREMGVQTVVAELAG